MGLFNFLNKDRSSTTLEPISSVNTGFEELSNDIPENIFIEKETPISQSPKPVEIIENGIDNNINLLYSFLDRNHEAKGYDDALINPDSSHLTQNLEALKNELERTINKVKTFYEDFIKEIEYHISSRGRSGMVDIVEELEMKKEIALSHMVKVLEIERGTQNDTGDCKGIMISYTRGFKNGLAAISLHTILKKRF